MDEKETKNSCWLNAIHDSSLDFGSEKKKAVKDITETIWGISATDCILGNSIILLLNCPIIRIIVWLHKEMSFCLGDTCCIRLKCQIPVILKWFRQKWVFACVHRGSMRRGIGQRWGENIKACMWRYSSTLREQRIWRLLSGLLNFRVFAQRQLWKTIEGSETPVLVSFNYLIPLNLLVTV